MAVGLMLCCEHYTRKKLAPSLTHQPLYVHMIYLYHDYTVLSNSQNVVNSIKLLRLTHIECHNASAPDN